MDERSLVVVARASRQRGIGHVMRSLAVAEEWVARGGTACYTSPEPYPGMVVDILKSRGFPLFPIEYGPGASSWLEQLLSVGKGGPIVIDDYEIMRDVSALQRIKERYAPLTIINDQPEPIEGADIYINPHPEAAAPTMGQALIGAEAALLRRDVLAQPRKTSYPEKISRVMISMGGTDPKRTTLPLIEILADALSPDEVTAVVGPGHPDIEQITQHVTPLISPPDFASRMAEADLLITAGGLTIWEAAYLGLPVAVVITDEAQAPVCTWLEQAGIVMLLGKAYDTDVNEKLSARLRQLADGSLRMNLGTSATSAVDGEGARRVVDMILAAG